MSDDTEMKPASLGDLPAPAPEEYPRPFGSYMFLAPVARGGMGEVFLAKHGSVKGMEKYCVVKTLRPHLTDDREYTTRFIDEARIVVQLGHANICHVFDVGMVGERYYLAMEYIAGKDLRSLAGDVGEKGGVVNPGLALHMVGEVLQALDYAHRHVDSASGKPLLLVHRDVSPQNIMLSWEGEVKLIDFGLAASTLKMEQTSPNVVMGKLAYMAPEQVRGEKVDGRADLFAVAVVLYELLVGERFYEGRSPYEIWGIAAQGGFRPRGWDAVPEEMKPILDRALSSKPDGRYATCLELREALEGYRMARTLRGDAPILRALMHQVYGKEIEDSRRNLSELSRAQPRDPLSPTSSGVFSVTTEPTVSLARSPSQASQSAPMGIQRPEGTEPTSMVVKAMFGSRRAPYAMFAAAGLVAMLGLGAFLMSRMGEKAPPLIEYREKVVEKPVYIERPAPSVVVDDDPATSASASAAAAADPPPPSSPPQITKVDRKKPRDQTPIGPASTASSAPPSTGQIAPSTAPTKTGDDVTVPKASGVGADIAMLEAKCPQLSCVKELVPQKTTYGQTYNTFEKLKAFRATVAACKQECAQPK